VGPGGHYLTQEHTRQHFRSETWFPTLIDRQMRRTWEASGSKTMGDRVRARVLDILEHHEPLPIAADVEARLKEIITQAEERHRN
jgi:trimethylamine--corrinoid protein Co-methyltransferase